MRPTKVKYHDKETPEIFNICDLPNNFLEAATKKILRSTKENRNIEKNL